MFVALITWQKRVLCLTLPMNWQSMYEVALDRIKQLNKEQEILEAILRSYLPIIEGDNDEKGWMVSVSKMVQSRCRTIQLILLCLIWQLGFVSLGWGQYSSIRVQQEDKGEILLFLINVVVHKVGKRLDKGYRCPVYCAVDHKHYYWEKHENKEGYIQTVDGLHRAARDSSQE